MAVQRAARTFSPEPWVLVACGLVAAGCVAAFARFGAGMQFCLDDWEWLGRGADVPGLIRQQLRFQLEVFRPLPQHLYALSYALFGLRPGPFAALLVAGHLLAAVGAARVVRLLGFSTLTGVMAALLVLLDPVSAESLQFFSLNQPVLGRAFLLLALAGLLAHDAPRRRAWLPWALLGICSHEQAALLAPLWVLGRLHRDGARRTLAAMNSPHGRGVLGLCLGYVALRLALRDTDPNLPHALGLRALPLKWALFVKHLHGFVAFRTGFALRLGTVPQESLLDPRRTALHLALLGGWIVALGAWVALGPAKALRTASTAALWALGGYAPYFLAVNESAIYHFNLSLLGVSLLPAAALGALWSRCEGRARPLRAPVVALGLATVLPLGRDYLRRPSFDAFPQISTHLRARLRSEPDGVSHLIFLDGAAPRGPSVPAYIAQMSGEFDVNRPAPPRGAVNWALALSFPGRNLRVWVLTPAHAPFLCLREGDLALEVHPLDLHGQRHRFVPVAPCARPGGLPPALDGATPEGAALASSTRWSASAAPGRLRAYWAAYATRDLAAQRAAGDALGDDLRALDLDPAARVLATRAAEAVRATMPLPQARAAAPSWEDPPGGDAR